MAIEAARASADRFVDGVSLVLLASLTDPDLVIPAVAQVLGVQEVAERSLRETLIAFLRPRSMLLVVDNFEHLLSAAVELGELLANCPGIAALVTSREPLRFHDEHVFVVPPLELPSSARDADSLTLLECASVKLFEQRAEQVVSGFQVTEDSVRAVADICLRLDGLPLAIELAAVRSRVLPPKLLLERLDQRLPLLVGGARDMPARQRTLRDTIAWSYDLLTATEARLFRRMAVFSGGFTLRAAEEVFADDQDTDAPVLDLVASLVDKNLVRVADHAPDDQRFVMLETIREFAVERLDASGEADTMRSRHARWMVQFAENAEPHPMLDTPVDGRAANFALHQVALGDRQVRAAAASRIDGPPAAQVQCADIASFHSPSPTCSTGVVSRIHFGKTGPSVPCFRRALSHRASNSRAGGPIREPAQLSQR